MNISECGIMDFFKLARIGFPKQLKLNEFRKKGKKMFWKQETIGFKKRGPFFGEARRKAGRAGVWSEAGNPLRTTPSSPLLQRPFLQKQTSRMAELSNRHPLVWIDCEVRE